jgi:hypothetical protein
MHQRLQIEQMSDVFLNRPRIPIAPRENVRGEIGYFVFNSRRRAAKSFENVGIKPDGEVEFPFPLQPG